MSQCLAVEVPNRSVPQMRKRELWKYIYPLTKDVKVGWQALFEGKYMGRL